MKHLVVLIALAVSIFSVGCNGKPLTGPPQLRLGRDECRECGMIISEDRCSSALIVERGGDREYAVFDDIGCMLDFERKSVDGASVIERHVYDYGLRSWTNADRATFVFTGSDKPPTPMSSGMIAFAQRRDAEGACSQFGGQLADYSTLATLRKAWHEQRRGPTSRSGG